MAKIDQLELLPQMYDDGFLPHSVLREIEAKRTAEVPVIRTWLEAQRIEVRQAAGEFLMDLPSELGAGEKEAIALALELQPDLLILDDQRGRRVAREKQITVTGTIGVLAEARHRGLIPAIRPALDLLMDQGLWLDSSFYHRIVEEFGE